MASEVQLDALPYVDQGYEEPGVREAVSKNICTLLRGSFSLFVANFCNIFAPFLRAGDAPG